MWGQVSWLVSDLVESSAVGSHLVQLGSNSDSLRGHEAVNMEVEGSTALETVTTQRLVQTQQTENDLVCAIVNC
jgi:hypothetical protein